MRRHLPTVLSGLALFVALGGTSIAAVSFARNAGAVDGKSAVGATSSLGKANGKLVAADTDGRLLGKFVKGVSHASQFANLADVTDGQTGAAAPLTSYSKIGALTATCADQATAFGSEDPSTTLTFSNTSGGNVNYSGRVGAGAVTVVSMAPATAQMLTITGSNTFDIQAQVGSANVHIVGTVRQDGKDTADAKCLAYGTLTLVN